MRYLKIVSVLCIAFIIVISCKDKSTNTTEKEVQATLYQIAGCPSHSSSLSKASSREDSCFTYEFKDKLTIDFCLLGCCQPDHDRYKLSYHISNDTLYVVAKDTAPNNANCVCVYTIHTEFENLPLDHYVFNCMWCTNTYPIFQTRYMENVYKNGR